MNNSSENPEKKRKIIIDDDDIIEVKPTNNELKVMNMTHTWKLMERKVNIEEMKSNRMSPMRQTM